MLVSLPAFLRSVKIGNERVVKERKHKIHAELITTLGEEERFQESGLKNQLERVEESRPKHNFVSKL